MAHYNLYESLGLPPNASTDELGARLDSMLSSGYAGNQGGRTELEIARKVLGDPDRRALYDQKLADPSAEPITVRDLRSLSMMSMAERRNQAQSSEDPATGEFTAVANPDQGYQNQPQPPQYRQAPPEQNHQQGYQQGYSQNYQPEQQGTAPKKSNTSKILGGLIAVLVIALLVMAGVWYFVLNPSWDEDHKNVHAAYPELISSRENGKGFNDYKCQVGKPDRDQNAKILCGDENTVISIVEFDSAEDRAKYLPTEDRTTLDNGTCAVESAEVTGNDKPTYALWSAEENQIAILVSGDDAENKRLELPLCS